MDGPEIPSRTLAGEVSVRGTGLHSGAEVTAVIRPREERGILFVREDLPGRPVVRASAANLGLELRRTVLNQHGASVQTAEHLLAVLYAFGVDRAEIRIDGAELPGLDGSSRIWLEEILARGLTSTGVPRRRLELPGALVETAGKSALIAVPTRWGLRVDYTLEHDEGTIPVQRVSFEIDPDTFARELAPCRTFVLESEIERLLRAGLGRGATTRNTLVIGPTGVRDNTLRFPDEFARHKVLDLVGDLSLVEGALDARVVGLRSGHELNGALAQRIALSCAEAAEADAVTGSER